MVSDVAPATLSVSGWVALRRAVIGAGLAAAACLAITLLGHPITRFLDATILIWAIVALYSGDDRHCRVAAASAAIIAALIWLGAATLHAGPAGAALGALAGSQVYAQVTRLQAR